MRIPNITITNAASFMTGVLSAFTVSLVGAMPVGELVLLAVLFSIFVSVVTTRRWPEALERLPLLWIFLGALCVAFCGYIIADFYRESATRDMARGWARIVFQGLDILAMGYLLGKSMRNTVYAAVGCALGVLLSALVYGALFGDMWKFGYAPLVTVAALLVAGWMSRWIATGVAFALGLLHFVMDYRAFGGFCFLVGSLLLVQALPRRWRPVVLPVFVAFGLVGIFFVYLRSQGDDQNRTNRSNLERSAMVQAAAEAFVQSPFIGHGSWFSNSRVMENFAAIRWQEAQIAHMGGFAEEDGDDMALHSQILVALAEGGVLGGAFFIVYGLGLVWALLYCVLKQSWQRATPVYLLTLISALWHLFMSPFSGTHRVLIALAAAFVAVLHREARAARTAPIWKLNRWSAPAPAPISVTS
jgi:O-antigen ligase